MNAKTIVLIVVIVVIALIAVIGGWFFFFQPGNSANQNQQEEDKQNIFQIQGMKVEILKEGTGEGAISGDNVMVDYTGTFLDGTKFDSSIDKGQSFSYTLGQNRVIRGWELGLVGMKVGEKRKLTIPPELAYGTVGAGNVIPPNATLIFEVELLQIN